MKAVLDSEDADAIKAKSDALQQAAMKIGEHVYRAMQDAENAAGATGDAANDTDTGPRAERDNPAADGEVMDATFEEVDDDIKRANG